MIQIIKQEIEMEKSLKQRLEFICQFCKTKPTFINGSIRKITKSNLNFIEPHKVIFHKMDLLRQKLYNFIMDSKLSHSLTMYFEK